MVVMLAGLDCLVMVMFRLLASLSDSLLMLLVGLLTRLTPLAEVRMVVTISIVMNNHLTGRLTAVERYTRAFGRHPDVIIGLRGHRRRSHHGQQKAGKELGDVFHSLSFSVITESNTKRFYTSVDTQNQSSMI